MHPKQEGGGQISPIRGEIAKRLTALVSATPDATIEEMTSALIEETGVATSTSPVGTSVAPSGLLTKKEKFIATKHGGPHNLVRRRWMNGGVDDDRPERLVFIDESSCFTQMAREDGWAPVAVSARPKHVVRSWVCQD